jgi:hypothetical protein
MGGALFERPRLPDDLLDGALPDLAVLGSRAPLRGEPARLRAALGRRPRVPSLGGWA